MAGQAGGTARAGKIETIRYGKADVSVYRTYARPLRGLTAIPESGFVGRENTLFACSVDVEVFGGAFARAYTVGDNSMIVATDTMKNFVHLKALEYDGATLEGFLHFLGIEFMNTYSDLGALRLIGRELPIVAPPIPSGGGAFVPSGTLFGRVGGDHAVATLELRRDRQGSAIVGLLSERRGLKLMKVTGSAFRSFVRDAYTTLPEVVDRPLFIHLDVAWRYADPTDAVGFGAAADNSRYVAAEQVRDLVQVVFHEFVSMSIQHLVHEMGQHLLDRFPQLSVVSFEAQNRLWDTASASTSDPKVKVYTDPRPPFGSIGLTLRRGGGQE